MDIKVKPLSPEMHAAFLDFFDNRAFTDDDPMGPCYCNAAIMSSEELEQMVNEFGDDCKGTLRRYAVRQLAENKIFGYLAFYGDNPVGWCNAGDMRKYPLSKHQAVPDFARENALENTISIICFAVAPQFRGKGVATKLLEYIIADAAARGFAAAEGYVNLKYAGHDWDYTGPTGLYCKFGFSEVARMGEQVIMRKLLK